MMTASTRAAKLAAGYCASCATRLAKPGRKCCQHCITRSGRLATATRVARRARGVCVECETPTEHWLCSECAVIAATKKRHRYAAKRLAQRKPWELAP